MGNITTDLNCQEARGDQERVARVTFDYAAFAVRRSVKYGTLPYDVPTSNTLSDGCIDDGCGHR